jgi:hypothetical protein
MYPVYILTSHEITNGGIPLTLLSPSPPFLRLEAISRSFVAATTRNMAYETEDTVRLCLLSYPSRLHSSISLNTTIHSTNIFDHDQEISARPSSDTVLCAGDLDSAHHLHLPFRCFS